MKIYTLWQHEGDSCELPFLVGAVDEYTVEENDGFPEDYAALRALPRHRELVIEVPLKAVRALFESPSVKGSIVGTDR
jgi:hypothetical protein